MPFKLNISEKGKSWKLDVESDMFLGKKIGDLIHGKELSKELEGYELEIAGASDMSGFPHKKEVEGPALKRVLLKKGWGMRETHEGVRRRKTVRGKELSEKTIQINLKVKKDSHKKLHDIFPDQNKPKEKKIEAAPALATK